MSKVVTIPDYTRPNWVCCINGVRYAYPAGSTQEVPDEVADLIEDQMEHLPVPDPAKPSGGVSSWNDLTDKPFYEETKVTEIPAINIEWDGNTEGLEYCDMGEPNEEGHGYYKVSNDVFPVSAFDRGWSLTNTYRPDGHSDIFTSENVTRYEIYDEGRVCGLYFYVNPPGDSYNLVLVACEDVEMGGIKLTKGVWFDGSADGGGWYVQSLTIPGSTVTETKLKTIEPKFLPDNVATKDYIEEVILGGAW